MDTETGFVEQVTEAPVATETRVDTPNTTVDKAADQRVSMADQLTARLGKTDKLRNPNRDEPTGRFAPKPADKAPEKVNAKPADVPSVAPAVATQAPEIKAPSTLKPEEAAHYLKAPPEVRAIIDRREADYQKGVQQLRPAADLGRAVQQASAPFAAMLQAEGATVPQAVQSLLGMAYTLRTGTPQQKAQLIANTAKQFGVDLGALTQGAEQQQVAPEYQALQNELAELRNWRQNLERSQAQQLEQGGLTAIQSFSAEKDAQGQPLRPHLNDVMNEMLAFVPMVKQANPAFSHSQILQEAYDRAAWANPGVRAKLQAAAVAKAQSSEQAQATQRVQAARSAAGSVTGSPGVATTANSHGLSIRDNLKAGFAGRA